MRSTCPASIYGTLEKYLELMPQGKNSNKNTALKGSHPHSDTLLDSLQVAVYSTSSFPWGHIVTISTLNLCVYMSLLDEK